MLEADDDDDGDLADAPTPADVAGPSMEAAKDDAAPAAPAANGADGGEAAEAGAERGDGEAAGVRSETPFGSVTTCQ